ncbi:MULTISPECIES: hypothetical protein [unclassified Sphingomonas]|uniref:hypothetical protein n=1 Tax=unclassified Sphingomonas TaxID=196159 RepID=UPI00226A21E6|nr:MULTISPECIES: hypothetical protein [unclassified Sphingomonas]
MFLVRIHEGTIEDAAIIHDTKLPIVPRVGEKITIRWPDRREDRFKVIAVNHLLEVKAGISLNDDLVGVQVQVQYL